MTETRTVGVIGTLVWDRIVGLEQPTHPIEGWGGIAYSLAALSASLPDGWSVRPIVKLGSDLADEGRRLLRDIPRVDQGQVVIVPEDNNRVELSYETQAERTERLSGGVPSWSWGELLPLVTDCDALYVNFISGHEMDLPTAAKIRGSLSGPTYADLHSLFLGEDACGRRVPQILEAWESWFRCFHAVQMNEHEFARLGAGGDGGGCAGQLLGAELDLIAVTRGGEGATYAAKGATPGRVEEGIVTLTDGPKSGDPTGCGDVWGGAMFGRLLAGDDIRCAMMEANRLAGLKLGYSGARGLFEHFMERSPSAEKNHSEVTN